jgi:ribosomal-protein-alanine N-acetyltransferase
MNCTLVADTDGAISGFAVLRNVAGEAELLNLAVAPEHRRHGIGRQLVEAVMEHTRQNGARKLFLEVRASNAGACALYASLGFSDAGSRKNYYHDPVENALVLSRVLV